MSMAQVDNKTKGKSMTTTSNASSLLIDELLKDTTERLKADAEAKIDALKTSIEARVEGLKVELNDTVSTLEVYTTGSPLMINIGTIAKPKKVLVHSAFDRIIRILKSTKRKEKNIMLVGGAGGGKTHLVSSLASAISLPFYPMSVGLQTTKSDLLGFINATGVYVTSIIRKAYEEGGVLLLDEFDSAHAGVVTILNSLLANGHCSFPDKIVQKHKDFICLCACNTYGKGGNVDYVGRNRLDGATLDRFIIVDVDYDAKLEKALTSHQDWLDVINKIRKNADAKGVKVIISPRASMDGADLLDAGFDVDDVLSMVVFKGCDADIKGKLMSGVVLSGTLLKQTTTKKGKSRVVAPSAFDIDVLWDDKTGHVTTIMNDNSKIVDGESYEFGNGKLCCSDSYNIYCSDTLYLPKNTKANAHLWNEYHKPDIMANNFKLAQAGKIEVPCSIRIEWIKKDGSTEVLEFAGKK